MFMGALNESGPLAGATGGDRAPGQGGGRRKGRTPGVQGA